MVGWPLKLNKEIVGWPALDTLDIYTFCRHMVGKLAFVMEFVLVGWALIIEYVQTCLSGLEYGT